MTSRRVLLLLALAMPFAAGCGDSMARVYRDAIACQNEVADALLHVTDDVSAEEIQKTRIDRLVDEQWKAIKDRGKKLMDGATLKDAQYVLRSFVAMLDDYLATQIRFKRALDRLENLSLIALLGVWDEAQQKGMQIKALDQATYRKLRNRLEIALEHLDKIRGDIEMQMKQLVDRPNCPKLCLVVVRATDPEFNGVFAVFVDRDLFKAYQQGKGKLDHTIQRPEFIEYQPVFKKVQVAARKAKIDNKPFDPSKLVLAEIQKFEKRGVPFFLDNKLVGWAGGWARFNEMLDGKTIGQPIHSLVVKVKEIKMAEVWDDNPLVEQSSSGPGDMMGGFPGGGFPGGGGPPGGFGGGPPGGFGGGPPGGFGGGPPGGFGGGPPGGFGGGPPGGFGGGPPGGFGNGGGFPQPPGGGFGGPPGQFPPGGP